MNDDGLLLGTKNSEFGEYSEEVAASIEGDKINVCFSGAYIIDALKALDTDEVVIKFVGEMKPFIAENVGSDKDIVELMLPIRTYNWFVLLDLLLCKKYIAYSKFFIF